MDGDNTRQAPRGPAFIPLGYRDSVYFFLSARRYPLVFNGCEALAHRKAILSLVGGDFSEVRRLFSIDQPDVAFNLSNVAHWLASTAADAGWLEHPERHRFACIKAKKPILLRVGMQLVPSIRPDRWTVAISQQAQRSEDHE